MFDSFIAGGNAVIHGASRGLGLEFVRQLLAESKVARVFATCRVPAAASALQALAMEHSSRLTLLTLDLTQEGEIAAAAQRIAQFVPRLHLSVNCAGVLHDVKRGMSPEKRLADINAAALEYSFAVNALGPLLLARHFEPLLGHAERAVFASVSARVGSISDNRLGGWYAYRGSKAAQNMFMRTLAIEWARSRRNVICVALHPGTTDTDLSRPFQANVPAGRLFQPERSVRQLLSVMDKLQLPDSGQFFGWDGETIPW
jgi:NAD(P)-dependent dehydrogenase (short-subunit alcohol dehydrogenase family)